MCTTSIPLVGSLLFFDLAGTVVEADAPVTEHLGRVLKRVAERVQRLVMVTGQPLADAQVQAVLRLLAECPAAEASYVTRGGVRLLLRSTKYEVDPAYSSAFALDAKEVDRIEDAIDEVLSETGIEPLVPVSILDQVTVRLNVEPHQRKRLLSALQPRLPGLKAEAEGRTSIYVSKVAMNKQSAVRSELLRASPAGPVYYLGNEVADGNDRPVLAVEGVQVLAVGDCGQVPPGSDCRSVADSVNDLLDLLESST